MNITLSDDELEARAQTALDLIAEARKLELQAKAKVQDALQVARSVLAQTDAPYIYDSRLHIIIYPRHPANIKAGLNPITHARTEATTKAALLRIERESRKYKYSLAVARLNALNENAKNRRKTELGFKRKNPYAI